MACLHLMRPCVVLCSASRASGCHARLSCVLCESIGLVYVAVIQKRDETFKSSAPALATPVAWPHGLTEASSECWGARSIPWSVRPRIQTDRAPESLVRHRVKGAALYAERCRQSIRNFDCGPTRSG